MSKKRAVDYNLEYLRPNRPYLSINFIDKKGRTMISSVDVVLNATYLTTEEGEWDLEKLNGFVRTR